ISSLRTEIISSELIEPNLFTSRLMYCAAQFLRQPVHAALYAPVILIAPHTQEKSSDQGIIAEDGKLRLFCSVFAADECLDPFFLRLAGRCDTVQSGINDPRLLFPAPVICGKDFTDQPHLLVAAYRLHKTPHF